MRTTEGDHPDRMTRAAEQARAAVSPFLQSEDVTRDAIRAEAMAAQSKLQMQRAAAVANGADASTLMEIDAKIGTCADIAQLALQGSKADFAALRQQLTETVRSGETAATTSSTGTTMRSASTVAQISTQEYQQRSAEIRESIAHTYAIDRENRTFADTLARKHGIDLSPFDQERGEIDRKRKEAETKGDPLAVLKQDVLAGSNTLNRLYAVPDEKLTDEERKARDTKAAEQVQVNEQRMDAFKQQAELDAQKNMPRSLDADAQKKWREDYVENQVNGLEKEIDKLHGKVPEAVVDQLSAIKKAATDTRSALEIDKSIHASENLQSAVVKTEKAKKEVIASAFDTIDTSSLNLGFNEPPVTPFEHKSADQVTAKKDVKDQAKEAAQKAVNAGTTDTSKTADLSTDAKAAPTQTVSADAQKTTLGRA